MSWPALFVALVASGVLSDPAQEARAQSLEMEIRCVQCQNEPIAQSTADIAADMRNLVRERIAAGASDDQIRAFFRQRYGDYVLFRPPWDARTWALWASPFVLAGLGLLAFAASIGRRSGQALTPEDDER